MSTANQKTKALVTLKSVVANVKVAKADYTTRGFNRLMQLAIRGYKQLNLHGGLTYESQWVALTDVKTVPFPPDFVKLVAVGIPHRGQLWTWTTQHGLIEPHTESDGVKELSQDNGETQAFADSGYLAGYGVPGGRNEVNILVDNENGQIIINNYSGTKVLLYYKSTGVSLSEDTMIPAIAEEALIAWVHWKDIQFSDANQYEKESAKMEYFRAYQSMIDAKAPTMDELYDAIYSGYMQAPKR